MKKLISALSIIEFATVLVINASTIGIITEIIAETKTTIAPKVSFLNQFFMRKNKLLKKLYLSFIMYSLVKIICIFIVYQCLLMVSNHKRNVKV